MTDQESVPAHAWFQAGALHPLIHTQQDVIRHANEAPLHRGEWFHLVLVKVYLQKAQPLLSYSLSALLPAGWLLSQNWGWSLLPGAEIVCPHLCSTVALGWLPGLVPSSF